MFGRTLIYNFLNEYSSDEIKRQNSVANLVLEVSEWSELLDWL